MQQASRRAEGPTPATPSPGQDHPTQHLHHPMVTMTRYICVKYDPDLDTVFVYKRIGQAVFGWQWWLTDWLGEP
jgi:hypothetical protein